MLQALTAGMVSILTLGRTRKLTPHHGTRGRGVDGVFDMLQYFETTLPLVESL